MSLADVFALRRAHSPRAKFSHILRYLCQKAWRGMTDQRQFYPSLTDRQARDIGLDPADMEWRRLQLPSRNTHHPRL